MARLPPVQHRVWAWARGSWTLSLRGKLLVMMFGLLLLVLAILFGLYWRAERQLISQVERHTTDLSTAIQISVEQLTSKGRTSEARLQDYVQRLQQRGVREISIVSNEEEVIASSNPRRVGVRVDPKRKDILITARLGEETAGGVGQTTYNLLLPIVVGNQRSGYILISMILDNFAEIARANFLKRLAGTVLIFAFGIGGAVVLAWTYTKPISQVVAVARRVAQGKLDERLPANRRDEIGELNRSFNEMVERLKERAELEARLHQAERLSAIAHLASGIAHEVRNPLSTISMTVGHLRAHFPPPAPAEREEFDRLTSMVMEEIRRLDDMIRSFLKYGKPLNLTRQAADIRTLLDEVLDVAAQRAAAESIAVTRDYANGLPGVWVDVPHLKTCFMNLVLNAFQAMSGGGALRVSAMALAGPEGQGDAVPTGRVEIRFQDTGTGIAPEDLPKVFEPYFTTKEVGIGLGLALTKQIVEEHGGRIEISSELGQGTLVRLQLPVGAPKA
ncbi:MAG: Periplasmic sensor signal transduction histidine kinase precursor [candidate division NC10 bacterium]|nr:Periplasmic sensor signal transduction histidine kinase precursor [candidate division NC10 bacterium]